MSAVSDEIAAIQGSLNSIATGITSLDSQIQAFEAQAGDTLTPATQAALDAIKAQSATLATQANAAVTPPASPSPTPTPGT